MRKYLCWLLGHNFICLFRHHWGTGGWVGEIGSEFTAWICQHCGKQRTEQWDT